MSDDKKKSESKDSLSGKEKETPKKREQIVNIELEPGESETITSGSESPSTVNVQAEDAPKPKIEMKASEPELQPQLSGKHTIRDGDTPFSVALEMYGRGSMGGELRRKNRNVPWKTGNVITL